METITLFGVTEYQPDLMIAALRRYLRSAAHTFSARRLGDRVQVTIQAEDDNLVVVSENVVRFYLSWRRGHRVES